MNYSGQGLFYMPPSQDPRGIYDPGSSAYQPPTATAIPGLNLPDLSDTGLGSAWPARPVVKQLDTPTQNDSSDDLDTEIKNMRSTLSTQVGQLQDAIRNQFQAPRPQMVRPTFTTKDLLWAIPAGLLAMANAHNPGGGGELAAGVLGGVLQGRQGLAEQVNQHNMGMYNMALQQARAGVEAQQVGVQNTQQQLGQLMQMRHMDIMMGLGGLKLQQQQAGKLEDQIKSGGPEERMAAAQGLNDLFNRTSGRVGRPFTSQEAQVLGNLRPGEQYQQAGVGLRGAQTNATNALASVRTQTADFLAASKDPRLAKIGNESRLLASKADALDMLTPERVKYMQAQEGALGATTLYRQALTAAVPERTNAYVQKAYADINHMATMDQTSLAKFSQSQATALNASLHNSMSGVNQQITKLEGDKVFLEKEMEFAKGQAATTIKAHLDDINGKLNGYTNANGVRIPGLYEVATDLGSKATILRQAMGLAPDGTGKIDLSKFKPQVQRVAPSAQAASQPVPGTIKTINGIKWVWGADGKPHKLGE